MDDSPAPHHELQSLTSAASPSPQTTPRRQRQSVKFADQIASPSPALDAFDFENSKTQGLGIGLGGRTTSISRKPVGSQNQPPSSVVATPDPSTVSSTTTPIGSPDPSQSKPFLSPKPNNAGAYTYNNGVYTIEEEEVDLSTGRNSPYDGDGYEDNRNSAERRLEHSEETLYGDGEDFHKAELQDGCPSKRDIHSSRRSWLSISILILSIYSTIFSGTYLVIALMRPRYGKMIQSRGGRLTPETASVIFALFAKTIELSFVSVFVSFLGQVLSRRSLIKASRGVTIAELTMRNWILQPAFLITHVDTLKHAGLTFLGLLTLTNGFVAMFYTTASDSLVSPHLKLGAWEQKTMHGIVETPYANPFHVVKQCHNPTADMDTVYGGTTCLSVLHAGQAHSNHITFLDDWTTVIKRGGIVDPFDRPRAPAMLFDNTTVTGSWILKEWSNITFLHEQYNRVVDNVTMAMPHAGIFAAARNQRNGILQPENLGGVGEYQIRASVVSPAVNVLCANMNKQELAPLVYTAWPNAVYDENEQIPGQRLPKAGNAWENSAHPSKGEYFNRTNLDDIFEWGVNFKTQPPVFPMYPIEYNSIINVTVPYAYTEAIYILFKAPNTITEDYTLCKLRSTLSPKCSTSYAVSGRTGGQMRSVCEDDRDSMQYAKLNPGAPTNPQRDWINIGSELVRALSLGTGISNANASSARLVSQLITPEPKDGIVLRNASMPSISESLAVMAGSTLLLSSMDATYLHYWSFKNMTIDPTEMAFEAVIQSQEYASGFVQRWTIVFYIILLIVFVTNVFCLVYFFIRSGLVTDFSEPQNLFALAINSPISRRLFGSCGGGPEGKQFNVDLHVMTEDDSGHFFIKEGERDAVLRRRNVPVRDRSHPSPGLKSVASYSKLSNKRKSWL